jgi:hypothetical protein
VEQRFRAALKARFGAASAATEFYAGLKACSTLENLPRLSDDYRSERFIRTDAT